MAKITYIDHSGVDRTTEVPNGKTVMEGARDHAIPGIDAECGGACACATCHVFVNEEWMETVGAAARNEQDMLEFATGVQRNSRLSCQIMVTDALDGLVVRTPASQH